VLKTGNNVKNIKEGDYISVETHIIDNTCYQCRNNRRHICRNLKILGVDINGVFSEYVSLPAYNVWIIDKSVPVRLSSLLEPLGNAVHALTPENNFGSVSGKTIAILGAGPMGLMATLVAKFMGAEKIFVTDLGNNEKRLDLAKYFGANRVFNVREENDIIISEILDSTNGNGVDIVLEMSGSANALKQGFEIVTKGGIISILSVYQKPFEIDVTNKIVFSGIKIYGITGRRIFETWYRVHGLIKIPEFQNKISKIFTKIVPIESLAEAMDALLNDKEAKISLDIKWK
jgi:threonine 3-dehydrogenase